MTNHNYQYDINSLLTKDGGTGAISGFALQLDSILHDNEPLNETGLKVLDEALKLLSELAGEFKGDSSSDFEEGYREGFEDASEGHFPRY